jgi:hypothetical protein
MNRPDSCPNCGASYPAAGDASGVCVDCGFREEPEPPGFDWPVLPPLQSGRTPDKGRMPSGTIDAAKGSVRLPAEAPSPDDNRGAHRRWLASVALGLITTACLVWYVVSSNHRSQRFDAARSQSEAWFQTHALGAPSGATLRSSCRAWAAALQHDERDAVARSVKQQASEISRPLESICGPFPEPLATEAVAWLDMLGSFYPCQLIEACDLRVVRVLRAWRTGRTPTDAEIRECIVVIREAAEGCRSESLRKRLTAMEIELRTEISARESAFAGVTQ